MPEDSAQNPEDEFRDMLSQFLSGNGDIDPARLASAAGLPDDPEMIRNLIAQLQSAMQSSGDGINWDLALEQAKTLAAQGVVATTPVERSSLEQAFHIAALWLDEATYVSELTSTPRLMSRLEWITATMPIWTQLAEPVALSIANSLTQVLRDQAPEEMSGMIEGASKLMRNVGGTLFAMQLGQVVGQLASEAVSGGDIGIPLLGSAKDGDQQAAILPQNVAAFGAFVDVGVHQDGLIHISAMSHTFIKDPREVVKPGDIVKVKVLEVEVDRKRIALSLRMDDPIGAKAERPKADRGPRFSEKNMTSRAPSKPEAGGGAFAEAMRRAAEKGNGKGR